MSDLIKREAVLNLIQSNWYGSNAFYLNHIREIPSIDDISVRHGKWIPHEDEDGEHYGDKCSECGEWYVMPYGKTNFCPNCGADMRGEE